MNSIFVAFFLCMAAMVSGSVVLLGQDDGQWRGEGLLESQDWAGRSAWASPVSTWGAPGVWGSGLVRSAGVVAPGLITPGVVANNWDNTWAINGGW